MNKIHNDFIKILADLHTPVGVYNKLRDIFPNALLLESADYHDRTDNKSIICLEPIAGFEARGNKIEYNYPNKETVKKEIASGREIFSIFKEFLSSYKSEKTTPDLPINTNGFWGYSSFEAVQYMEDIKLNKAIDEVKDNPDLKYQFFRYVLIFDHFKKELYITQSEVNQPVKSREGIHRILEIINSNNISNFAFATKGDETSDITDKEYKDIVAKGIKHCKIGDTFQVVLSREFRQKFTGDDFMLYRCLRSISPSPYLFYLDYSDFKIFGSSPESQLQVHQGVASINPIAGTVRRGQNPEEDKKRASELSKDPKEISEHVMLVDLARNDLSKSSEKVDVQTYAEIQYFSQVIHMVSKVQGVLFKDKKGIDLYSDTFPAGTLSGAPKYRAMEIIAQNERNSRSFYGGAVGFLGFDGTVNHAIIIRSLLSKNNTLVYQAGAGVVSDSTPEGELQEVKNKLAAIRLAIQKANTL